MTDIVEISARVKEIKENASSIEGNNSLKN